MSECSGAPAERYLEPYLRNTLPKAVAKKFEEHYYGCEVCLAQLEALEAVELKLGKRPRKALGILLHWPAAFYAVGAIAEMLVVGLLLWRPVTGRLSRKQEAVAHGSAPLPIQQIRPQAQAAPATPMLHQLADMNLPVFQIANLRGQKVNPALVEGMNAYARHDCGTAVKALSDVKALDPYGPMARLYSGVCLMHDGKLERAAQTLKAAALVNGSPEQETAWYYLAQIALTDDDAIKARHYLALTISSHGDMEQRARGELKRIPADEGLH